MGKKHEYEEAFVKYNEQTGFFQFFDSANSGRMILELPPDVFEFLLYLFNTKKSDYNPSITHDLIKILVLLSVIKSPKYYENGEPYWAFSLTEVKSISFLEGFSDGKLNASAEIKIASVSINYLASLASFYLDEIVADLSSRLNQINRSYSVYDVVSQMDIGSRSQLQQVFIYLAAEQVSLFTAELVTNASGDFMDALGYELEVENEPIFGSFIKRLFFKAKEGLNSTASEIESNFLKGKKALELKYVELPTAEQTEKLANAAAKLIDSLRGEDEAIVRLGAIIVVKVKIGRDSKIHIHQLNFDLIKLFDQKPQLLQSPLTVYELLTGKVHTAKAIDESGTEAVDF